MFKVLLWDIDNTLLDFSYAESHALRHVFSACGFGVLTDEQVAAYSAINDEKWKQLEKGMITKEQVMHNRFADFLAFLGAAGINPDTVNAQYEDALCDYIAFIENGLEVVTSLKGKYRQYAVTNGAYNVQKTKLEKTGLIRIFDGAFISDEIGFEKPSCDFFNYVFAHIIPCERDEILIIGDSLSSDMQGGNNVGIRCCRFNPKGNPDSTGLKIDYEIRHLSEIYRVLTDNGNK